MRILLVETGAGTVTTRINEAHGVIVCAEDADEAMTLLRYDEYDLVLVSMGSGPEEGLALMRSLRAAGDVTPIMALTDSSEDNRSEAMRAGADDALADPFDAATLRARLIWMLRGRRAEPRLGDLKLCRATRQAWFRDESLKLTPMEFSVLALMASRRGTLLTRATFQTHLPHVDGRVLDGVMCKLRRKLDCAGADGLISVVWEHGYVLGVISSADADDGVIVEELRA